MSAAGFELQFDGHQIAGDVPSRMFNAALWPNVDRLYRDCNIAVEPVNVSQTYRRLGEEEMLRFSIPLKLKEKLATAIDSGMRHMMAETRRLQQLATVDLESGSASGPFSAYLARNDFASPFTDQFLYPALSATVCTCSDKAIDDYPAKILLDGLEQIVGSAGLWRVTQGSTAVVNELAKNIDDLRCDTAVKRVTETQDAAIVDTVSGEFSFDRVIVATQANHVAQLCPELSEESQTIFASFGYEDVKVVVHTDLNLMPVEPSRWGVFNFVSSNHGSMCTVWLNQFHCQWPASVSPLLQTIKPIMEIDPEKIVSQTRLQRPVVNDKSWKLWRSVERFNKQSQRLKFCGSYAVAGIPLLESAVVSAMQVCEP